jgi:hypothetical protein
LPVAGITVLARHGLIIWRELFTPLLEDPIVSETFVVVEFFSANFQNGHFFKFVWQFFPNFQLLFEQFIGSVSIELFLFHTLCKYGIVIDLGLL